MHSRRVHRQFRLALQLLTGLALVGSSLLPGWVPLLHPATALAAQGMVSSACGNENEPPCIATSDYARKHLAEGSGGRCDSRLALNALGTACINQNRHQATVAVTNFPNTWEYWVMRRQRELSRDIPLNHVARVVAHNAYEYGNQTYSFSDLLSIGVRDLDIDVHFCNGAARMSHGGCVTQGRYHFDGIKEVRNWLRANENSNEVVTITYEDYVNSGGGDDEDINAPIREYLGDLVFTPAMKASDPRWADRWPTTNELVQLGKRVVLLNRDTHGDKWFFKESGWKMDDGYDLSNHLSKFNEDQCTLTAEDGKGNDTTAHGQPEPHLFMQVGEDRASSSTDWLRADHVSKITACSLNVGLDYILADDEDAGKARLGATSWTFDSNGYYDPNNCVTLRKTTQAYGSDQGWRWHQVSCAQTRRYVCQSRFNAAELKVTPSAGTGGAANGSAACKSAFGDWYDFALPTAPYQQRALTTGTGAQVNTGEEVWLNYGYSCGRAPVTLYNHSKYNCAGEGLNTGYMEAYGPGAQSMSGLSLGVTSVFNDEASSVTIRPGWSVKVYEDLDMSGNSLCLASSTPDFSVLTFPSGPSLNDSVSAFEVFPNTSCQVPTSPAASLYIDRDYATRGRGRGDGYMDAALPGFQNLPMRLNDQVSSVRLSSGMSVMLYEATRRGGGRICLNGSVPNFDGLTFDNGAPLNDAVSSFELFRRPDCQRNIARGKVTRQSSTAWDGLSSFAVDENADGNYFNSSVTHTSPEYRAWWEVDLGGQYSVSKVELWNRTDCCQDRLQDFYVILSDTPFPASPVDPTKYASRHYQAAAVGIALPLYFDRNPKARYMRVQLANAGELSLAEAVVFGNDDPGALVGIAGKCVELPGGNTANGTQVQLNDCQGTLAQAWTPAQNGTIIGMAGKCLEASGGGTANGTLVTLNACDGTAGQKWDRRSDGTLRNRASGRCLDVPGGVSTSGTGLNLWDCNGGLHQRWSYRFHAIQ